MYTHGWHRISTFWYVFFLYRRAMTSQPCEVNVVVHNFITSSQSRASFHSQLGNQNYSVFRIFFLMFNFWQTNRYPWWTDPARPIALWWAISHSFQNAKILNFNTMYLSLSWKPSLVLKIWNLMRCFFYSWVNFIKRLQTKTLRFLWRIMALRCAQRLSVFVCKLG